MRMMALVVAGLLVGCAGGGMDSEAPDAQAIPTQASTGGSGGAGGAGGSGGSPAPAPDAGAPKPAPDAMPAPPPPADAMPAPAGPPQACVSKEMIHVSVCMKDTKVLYRSDGRACDICATYRGDGRTVDMQFVGCIPGAGAICVQSCDECQPR